jgi:hypothetical protein
MARAVLCSYSCDTPLLLSAQAPPPTQQHLIDEGYLTSDGKVVGDRLYYMFYMGDYDSAAWLYSQVSMRCACPLQACRTVCFS